MGNTEFKYTSGTVEVLKAMNDRMSGALDEVAGLIVAQTKRNTKVGKVNGGELKGSWEYVINSDATKHTAIIGSPLERSIWYEFGTGEYALEGRGRKGGWYIPVGSGEGCISEATAKAYGFTIRNGKDGKKWVFTKGMKAHRPFFKAYTSKKNACIRKLQNAFKGGILD